MWVVLCAKSREPPFSLVAIANPCLNDNRLLSMECTTLDALRQWRRGLDTQKRETLQRRRGHPAPAQKKAAKATPIAAQLARFKRKFTLLKQQKY